MELNLDAQIKTLTRYKWLFYPLTVFFFIWVSYTQVLLGPGKLLDKITFAEKKISELTVKKTARETKLSLLKLSKTDVLQARLTNLLQQMPYEHRPWDILTILKIQGVLSDFKMAESKLMQVEYKIEDSDKLLALLLKLEAVNPLLSISTVVFNPPVLKLEINSAYTPLQNFTEDFGRPLPNSSK
jgi:hypothetical protein